MLHSAATVISGRTLIHQTVWLPFRCRVPWTKFLSHGFKPLTAFCINIWKHFKTYNYAGYSSLVQPMSGFHRYLRHNLCFCEQQTHATLWGCRGDRIKLTANEGRPRPEVNIGNAKTNTEERKWHTYTQTNQYKQKTCQTL